MYPDSFLTRVIDDGIEAARRDYVFSPDKLKGAVAGFEACRGKAPAELAELLAESRRNQAAAYFDSTLAHYWELTCYAAEVEWVCNVLSAALMNGGGDPIVPVTARGMMKAAGILGVRETGT